MVIKSEHNFPKSELEEIFLSKATARKITLSKTARLYIEHIIDTT